MARKATSKDRYAQDNRLAANPAAYVTIVLLIAAVGGLFLLFWWL